MSAGEERPSAGEERPSAGDERPSAGDERPSAGDEHGSAGDQHGSAGDERLPAAGPAPDSSPGRHGLAELIAERRSKGQRVREADPDAYPYSFPNSEPVSSILQAYEHLATGEETEAVRRVAGRLEAKRGAGKAAFLDLVDRTGKIQLHARVDVLGRDAFERLVSLDLGDVVGVDGAVLRTRHGELTLRVDSFQLLAKALRPPPDKHHGLSDVETRHRRRELDLIANEGTRRLFLDRARIIAAVRAYLDENGFIEVETPVLQPLYGGALARPFVTHHNELERDLYLRIATELYLKRLIVGGLERVYELGKDFRNEGVSPKHNPEFTMVEFYEAYADYQDEATRLEELVRQAARAVDYSGELDFERPWRRLSFQQAIAEQTGIDVLAERDPERLREAISRQDLEKQIAGDTWFLLADDLLSKVVEPNLKQPTFVLDYPVELSPLAREHRSVPGLVERWEAFVGGIEIANAFTELIDPDVQRQRFRAQSRLDAAGVPETMPFDESFIEALEQGMPPAGGVGLGIDRLVMLLTGRESIREVVLFPAMRD
jgi:lysyl-tRNA synthetase class 2